MTTKPKTPEPAHAGNKGPQVRSDCCIEVAPADSGGLHIDLTSKVAALFETSIRDRIQRAAQTLGLDHATITITDAGALPFVLTARLEAAVRRTGLPVKQPYLPDPSPGFDAPSQPDRLRRSRLYLPGNQPKFMISAAIHQPDALILDLEDSVAQHEKDAARILVRNALRHLDLTPCERMVRINPGDLGLADLDAVISQNVHLVLIPKTESAQDVRRIDEHINALRKTHNLDRPVYLMPIIESARGVANAFDIATASPNNVALTLGLEDLTADLGAQKTDTGTETLLARQQIVAAARAAGLQPIDSVYADVFNEPGLAQSIAQARQLGFEGKGCIHPRQIRPVHEGFAPTPAERQNARAVVAAFHDATAKGLSVVSLGTKMIDPPVVKRAQRLVHLAESMDPDVARGATQRSTANRSHPE